MLNTQGFNPETGEWNDSLTGDFLWGNTNIGEALSCVVTPFTWSLIGEIYDHLTVLPGYHMAGNIGGRPYQNASVMLSAMKAMGKDADALFKEMGGLEKAPEGLTIPVIPVSWWGKLSILLKGIRLQVQQQRALRHLPRFLARNPGWCLDTRRRAQAASSTEELLHFWPDFQARSQEAFFCVVATVWRYAAVVAPLRHELDVLVGGAEANTLLSAVSSQTELLASLGPVVGLSRVVRREMTREAYLETYGHRGPYEAELAAPRPAEDPAWLEKQLEQLAGAASDAEEMLARQRATFEAAWNRFGHRYPERAVSMQRRLAKAAEVSRMREAARSELTRQVWSIRTWALRVGELSGLEDGVFYLIADEVLDLLAGRPAPVATIPARKKTHTRYLALPAYPLIISGQFDPFAWAARPNRRHDIFDGHLPAQRVGTPVEQGHFIKGVPGSAGCVEGVVRRIDSPEAADQLRPGEILVTSQTNVGWTLLFPRTAAVVTDVGAPLSHAAIVARELGIPAVVGCGDATARLQTGDKVRVDGGQGVVELLESARIAYGQP